MPGFFDLFYTVGVLVIFLCLICGENEYLLNTSVKIPYALFVNIVNGYIFCRVG